MLPRLTWLVDNAPLTGSVDFGSVQRGANLDRRFTIINQTAQPLTIPAIAISLAVFGTNLLGDALRDILDPRQRS